MNNRAVSDVLGYVLLFSVLLLSITTVSIFGLSGLQETRDTAALANAEQGFTTLADGVSDVHRGHGPSRTVPLSLSQGSLGPGDDVVISVTVNNGSASPTYSTTFRPIVYESGDTRLVYSGTAVIREQADGAVAVREPQFVVDGNRTSIPLVGTTPERDQFVRGQSVQVDLQRDSNTVETIASDSDGIDVKIEIKTTASRAEMWKRMLDKDGMSCDLPGSETVECTANVGNVIVRKVMVTYGLST